ncbi:MAG: META domain-containing protein [bacterium]
MIALPGWVTAETSTVDAELENTYWRLIELEEQGIALVDGQRDPHFVLGAEQRMHGHTGCNRLFGRYESDTDRLKFLGLGSTRMACAFGHQLENEFLLALERTDRYRIEGQRIYLYSGTQLLAVFEATYLN